MPIPFGNQNRLGDIEYLCQNVRHGLTYSWQSGSFCWPMVEIPVHRRILGISSWQIQHCIFANPIWQSKQTRRYWVPVSGYSWQSRSICWHIIEVLAHRRSASQRVRKLRHGSGILGSNSPFHCRGFPGLWLKIIQNWDLQSCPEWASWVCMKPTLTSCESLWMLSFQPRHASRATNKPPMRMYLQYVVHFVYYRLLHSHHCFLRLWISGPSAHKIYQDNFTFRCRRLIPLHACWDMNLCLNSLLKAAANMPWTVSSVSTVHSRKVATAQLNHKCTSPAN